MIYRSLAKFLSLTACSFLLAYSTYVFAVMSPAYPFHYPRFYAGLQIAHAETTWNQLVSKDHYYFMQLSTPVQAHDFGTAWGGFLGYQFSPSFVLEATYMRYPNTRIIFSGPTFYDPFGKLGLGEFTTHTQAYSAIGKFIIPLANYRINAFLDAGVGFIHRNDVLATVTRVGPTFGLGFTANVSRHIITELGFEYYTGFAKSDHIPVKDFLPFLFSIYLRVGYRFI